MKKTLLCCLMAFATSAAVARETVHIIYAFGPGSNPSSYGRLLAQEANRSQDRYNFVFEFKPGAVGAIAAKHVAKTPNTILASTSTFFVRPNTHPEVSHTVADFSPLFAQCTAPMALASTRYSSWDQIPRDRDILLGISGASSHLVALQMQKQFPRLVIVPYKSSAESNLAILADSIDFSLGFVGEYAQWAGKVHRLAVTGPRATEGIPTMSSLGSFVLQLQLEQLGIFLQAVFKLT